MKAVTSFLSIALFGTVCSGADLFEENQALKTELGERQKQLEPLVSRNRNMEIQIATLKTVNDLASGRIASPPEAAPEKETAIWNYQLNSRKEYYGDNDYPPFAENVRDGDADVLKIIGAAGKNNCLIKYFSDDEFARVKGRKVTCTVMMKGENIAGNGQSKFMLMVHLANKGTDWPDTHIGEGSFDWRPVKFTYEVPITASGMAMVIGLQGPTGAIFFKDLKVTVPGAE